MEGIFVKAFIVFLIVISTFFSYTGVSHATPKNETIELNVICNEFDESGKPAIVVDNAMKELKARHPDLNIEINYVEYPYAQTHQELVKALSDHNNQPDVVCLDQIWLGEFAGKGLLSDLTII